MTKLLVILQLIPALIAVIKAVEEAIPGVGKGEQKLALIRGLMETAHAGITEHWPTIETSAALIVKALNIAKVFTK